MIPPAVKATTRSPIFVAFAEAAALKLRAEGDIEAADRIDGFAARRWQEALAEARRAS